MQLKYKVAVEEDDPKQTLKKQEEDKWGKMKCSNRMNSIKLNG